jgi:hypothetical protein
MALEGMSIRRVNTVTVQPVIESELEVLPSISVLWVWGRFPNRVLVVQALVFDEGLFDKLRVGLIIKVGTVRKGHIKDDVNAKILFRNRLFGCPNRLSCFGRIEECPTHRGIADPPNPVSRHPGSAEIRLQLPFDKVFLFDLWNKLG